MQNVLAEQHPGRYPEIANLDNQNAVETLALECRIEGILDPSCAQSMKCNNYVQQTLV